MSKPQLKRHWKNWFIYLHPASLRMLFLGFSAGLPSVLIASTLTQRLSEAEIDIGAIGFSSWVGMLFGFKWVWSPFVDKTPIPFFTRFLGRRRSWLLVAQLGILAGLIGMALTDVTQGLIVLIGFALLVAFASATQDIALDAYRIESAEVKKQGALIAMYQSGFRLAMIWAGAGALWIAARVQQNLPGYHANAWMVAYLAMAASMLVGIIATLLAPEQRYSQVPKDEAVPSLPKAQRLEAWVKAFIVAPFADFISRYRWQAAIILALIALYRISDMVMGVVSNPFYNEMGYTKDQIAAISKVFGLIMTLVGAFIGGVLVLRAGVFKILMIGAVASAATNLLFALLAISINDLAVLDIAFKLLGYDIYVSGQVVALIVVISMDNLSGGIASAAFVGYLSSLTSIQFSATQYALFSSLMFLIPRFLGGFSGVFVKNLGYPSFFVVTAVIGLPVLVLVWLASKVRPHMPLQQS